MKKQTTYQVAIFENGLCRSKYPKTWVNAKKYIALGAEYIFKIVITRSTWKCELIWVWYG